MYDTIFFFSSSQAATAPAPFSIASTLNFVYGAISGVLITLVGGFTAYFLQNRGKQRDAADAAKIMLQYINMVLYLEYGHLASIKKILEYYETGDPHYIKLQKFIFTPLMMQINDEYIQKLLGYVKFSKANESPEVIQGIVYTETLYRKCCIIEQYNDALDEEKLFKANEKMRQIFIQSARMLLDGIKLSQEEIFKVNVNAREKILPLGKSYSKRVLFCQQ